MILPCGWLNNLLIMFTLNDEWHSKSVECYPGLGAVKPLIKNTKSKTRREKKKGNLSLPDKLPQRDIGEHVDQTFNTSTGTSKQSVGISGDTTDPVQCKSSKTKSILSKYAKKLQGSKFRWLNEMLYTTTGEVAFNILQKDPKLFKQYHEGFTHQVQSWPHHPIAEAIKWLSLQPVEAKVVDFGCGEGHLADAVHQEVIGLDMIAKKPGIIACNMGNTPLEDKSADIVIFCLALMGVDYPKFLLEASRVLKHNGHLWIAEVRSRFSDGKNETFDSFLNCLRQLGYVLKKKDINNRMFVIFVLTKSSSSKTISNKLIWPSLKPCLYKNR